MNSRETLQNQERRFPGEKCGVFGVWTPDGNAAELARTGIIALEHRGQDSCGIVSQAQDGSCSSITRMGRASEQFAEGVIHKLPGAYIAIGHNRYTTSDNVVPENAQPLTVGTKDFYTSFAVNGNLFDTSKLKTWVACPPKGESDSAWAATFIHEQREHYSSSPIAVREALAKMQYFGTLSSLVMTNDGFLIGSRDPSGNRPLCLGRLKNGGWVIASESVALDEVKADLVREVKGGELVSINTRGQIKFDYFGNPRRQQPCIFEPIYFSRRRSFQNDQYIGEFRSQVGSSVAQRVRQKGIRPDVVVPVLNSGKEVGEAAGETLDLPVIPLKKNGTSRTFILPTQQARNQEAQRIFDNTITGIQGNSILIGEDSTVRGTNSARVVKLVRSLGASEVHLENGSPPVVNTCNMGININSQEELVAGDMGGQPLEVIEKIVAERLGADTVTYATIDDITKASNQDRTEKDFCYHCFGGPHPFREEKEEFPKRERLIGDKPKIELFISGAGTNMHEIMRCIRKGTIRAELFHVLSDNPGAYGIESAKQHGVPTTVLSSDGSLGDKSREQYQQKLISHIEQTDPDLLVLAGWMKILGDDFLKRAQEREIPVINLHPALLPKDKGNAVSTTLGRLPALRGMNSIEDAYRNPSISVSGVTVHQVLPGNSFDMGPVILTEEVRKRDGEAEDEFASRIRESGYRALPAAIQRILHVMKHGIDVSKGTFPW